MTAGKAATKILALVALFTELDYDWALMEPTAFESWLGGIAGLTAARRLLALQTLTSSRNVGSAGVGTPPALIPAIVQSASKASSRSQPASRIDAAGVAEPGQRRVDSVGCPHCQNRDVVPWGQASAMPRYRCKACRRTFNALTNAPLANLLMKDKRVAQTQAMIDGVTTAKAA
ncbi:MAG TPA: hypothetical protein VND19_11310 [Acetobacteraceae bacterium]|nr:hypothetical protein [Acetobacteraceae bacterium]